MAGNMNAKLIKNYKEGIENSQYSPIHIFLDANLQKHTKLRNRILDDMVSVDVNINKTDRYVD